MRENTKKTDKFLMLCQIFPPLAIANMALATDSLIFYLSLFSQCQFINIFPHENFTIYIVWSELLLLTGKLWPCKMDISYVVQWLGFN